MKTLANTYYPVTTDLVFKSAFDEEKLMQALLEECFEKSVEIIKFMPTEQVIENVKEKHKRLDLVVKIEGAITNIEVNTSYSESVIMRNFTYLCKMHSQNIMKKDANIYQSESIQINLNLKGKEALKTEYIMYSPKEKKALGVKFRYIEVNLDKYRQFWYDRNDEEIKKNPMLVAISILDEKELDEYVDYIKNENVKRMRDKVKYLNEDELYISELSYEERKELEQIQLNAYHEAKGLEQGAKQRAISIAKKLLSLGSNSIEDIASCTELTIEEVQNLKEELKEN